MTTAILFPWRDEPARRAVFAWVQSWWRTQHSDWTQVVGTAPSGPFSRTRAILDAASQTDADRLVVADADVICPGFTLDELETWLVPGKLHRLSPESTQQVMAGADWTGLPLSTDNRQDAKPYKVHECGTLVALTRAAFDTAPPDPRFQNWGGEDDAWAAALRCLVGPATRTTDDVVHLWHPPQDRISRIVGNRHNQKLARRYHAARRNPDAMRALMAEALVDA